MNSIKKAAIGMILLLSLVACGTENNPEQSMKINDSIMHGIMECEYPLESEIYELFLNGELIVEHEGEQLTISELFGDNDIEYCFLDIDGDGREELHIRDNTAYYVIKAVDGTPLILFKSWWNDYEPIVTDELCGFLSYINRGYGNEYIRFIRIDADGSREWETFNWTDTNENGYMDEEDDFRADTEIRDYEEIDMEQYIQYREEHYVRQAGHELVWTDKRLKDFVTWQEAYIDFLNKSKASWAQIISGDEYALIYVDDDDFPELIWYMGGSRVTIVSFYDGNVRIINPPQLGETKYMEYGGRFYIRDGDCNVYKLEKGEFSVIGTGWFNEHYYFYTGFQYKYFWEGREVTETEYEACINELIDTSECVEPSMLHTKDEMLEMLAEQD